MHHSEYISESNSPHRLPFSSILSKYTTVALPHSVVWLLILHAQTILHWGLWFFSLIRILLIEYFQPMHSPSLSYHGSNVEKNSITSLLYVAPVIIISHSERLAPSKINLTSSLIPNRTIVASSGATELTTWLDGSSAVNWPERCPCFVVTGMNERLGSYHCCSLQIQASKGVVCFLHYP